MVQFTTNSAELRIRSQTPIGVPGERRGHTYKRPVSRDSLSLLFHRHLQKPRLSFNLLTQNTPHPATKNMRDDKVNPGTLVSMSDPRDEGEHREHKLQVPLLLEETIATQRSFVLVEPSLRSPAIRFWPPRSHDIPSLGSPFEYHATDKPQGNMESSARPEQQQGIPRPPLVPVSRWSPDSDDFVLAKEEENMPTSEEGIDAQTDEPSLRENESDRYGPIIVSRYGGTVAELHAMHITGLFDIDAFARDSSLRLDDNGDAQGFKAPSMNHGSGNEFTLPFRPGPSRVAQIPDGELHHRRMSARAPAWETFPTSLHALYYADDPNFHRVAAAALKPFEPEPAEPAEPTKPSFRRQQDIPVQIGKKPLDLRLPGLYDTSAANAAANTKPFVHNRKDTDPFVDPPEENSQPLGTSPFKDQLPAHLLLGIPTPSQPYSLPSIKNPGLYHQGSSGFSSSSASSTAGPSYPGPRRLPTRIELELDIPPPALSTVSSTIHQTPEARARLDARKPEREAWIRTGAQEIIALARRVTAAEAQYQKTRTMADHEAWMKAKAAYADATDLNKRQEERRNMFMPEGMKAARMPPPRDEFGFPTCEEGEEKVLRFHEAFMERVCAEVKRNHDEKRAAELRAMAARDDGGEVTAEMLATLSSEEKAALKIVLGARVEEAKRNA